MQKKRKSGPSGTSLRAVLNRFRERTLLGPQSIPLVIVLSELKKVEKDQKRKLLNLMVRDIGWRARTN